MKTFTYEEVTQHTENSINCCNRLALNATSENSEAYVFAAVGAFDVWNRLTSGHQDASDYARLQQLAGLEL